MHVVDGGEHRKDLHVTQREGNKTIRPASADRTARAANFRRDLEAT